MSRKIPGRTGQQCAQRWRHKVGFPDVHGKMIACCKRTEVTGAKSVYEDGLACSTRGSASKGTLASARLISDLVDRTLMPMSSTFPLSW